MKIINLTTKDLKKIVNRVINESIYARRRAFQIETWLEDAFEYLDPLDYDNEFEYIDSYTHEAIVAGLRINYWTY